MSSGSGPSSTLQIICFVIALIVLAFTSVIDEIAQMTLLLRQAVSAERLTGVASVLMLGMFGAIFAGPIAAGLITRFGAKPTLAIAFLTQAVSLFVSAGFADQGFVVILAFFLGFSGSLYWSAILSVVSEIAAKLETTVDRVNALLQTIRNVGYVAGPSIGAAVAVALNSTVIFILLAGGSLASFAMVVLIKSEVATKTASETPNKNPTPTHSVVTGLRILLSNSQTRRVIGPFLVVVATTVPLNVGLVFVVTHDLELQAAFYGVFVACLSVGLVIGPIFGPLLANTFSYASIVFSASALLGVLLIVMSQTHSVSVLVSSLFLGGIANGVINTTVASLVSKSVPSRCHNLTMPAFVMLIQLTILCGYIVAAFLPHEAAAAAILVGGIFATSAALTSLVSHFFRGTLKRRGNNAS